MDTTPRCAFRHLVVEVTGLCNHSCLHCYNHWFDGASRPADRDRLSREEIHALVAKVRRDAPIEQVALSGGEPTLRPDLPEIVGDLVDDDFSPVVITNGSSLDDTCLRRFPSDTLFEITLFSTDEATHDRLAGRTAFERVLESMIRLRRAGHAFALAFVVTRLNWDHVTRTIQLGMALGAQAVMLNRVNLSRRVFANAPQIAPTARQLQACLAAADQLAQEFGVPVAVSVPVPPCLADPRDYPHLHFGWCPRGGEDAYYTIGTTGLLRPCNHSSVVLGDLRSRGFAELVESDATREFWRPEPPECAACTHPLRDRCRGGCPAAADECFGTREHIDPLVVLERQRMGGAPLKASPVPFPV